MIGKKTILAMSGAIIFASAFADTEVVDGVTWTYTIANGEATISGGSPAQGDLTVPGVLGGYPVTAIGRNAFESCYQLTSIVLPSSVLTIGEHAFYGTGLTSVELPEGLSDICSWAFCNCPQLAEVKIPSSVTSIGVRAFMSCAVLRNFVVSASNLTYAAVGGFLLTRDGKRLLRGPSVEEANVPGGVEQIDEFAFSGCAELVRVTIPASVEVIGEGAFSNCSGLTDIRVEEGNLGFKSVDSFLLSADGGMLLQYFGGETAVRVPEGVISLDTESFAYNRKLTSVRLPDSVTTIRDQAFWGCSNLAAISLPSNLTTVAYGIFVFCGRLSTVYVAPGDAERIKGLLKNAKGSGEDLSGIMFVEGAMPSDVKPDGTYTETVDGIEWTYVIRNGEASVGGGSSTNKAVSTMTSGAIAIPDALGGCPVTSVGDYAFFHCTEITSVSLPPSVTSIGERAFENCVRLSSVTIPTNVASIAYCAFWGCGSLPAVTIPASVTNIGECVFGRSEDFVSFSVDPNNPSYFSPNGLLCSKDGVLLAGVNGDVTIPDGIRSVGRYAFSMRYELTSVTIPASVTIIGDSAFENCTGLASVSIPSGATEIEGYAFSGCYSVTNVTIPPSVTLIGAEAFSYCGALSMICVARGDTERVKEMLMRSGMDVSGVTFTEVDIPSGSKPDGVYDEVVDGVTFNFTVIDGKASLGGGSNKATVVPTSTRGTVKVPATLGGCPVTALGRSAFDACSGVTEVILPDGLQDVGSMAFRGCASLQQALLPASVTSVGTGAFTGCTALEELTLPNGLASIGNYAFSYCKSVAAVTVPATVTSIGISAFEGCTGIESVRFNGNVPSGLTRSCLLDTATRVFYPRAYESAYAAIVPAEKFAGYSDAKGVMLMKAASAGQPVLVDDTWAAETLDSRFGNGKVAEFREKFGRDFAAALFKTTGKVGADGRALTVLDDFISGTDPTDGDSKLQAKIEIGADGKPKVTWTPDLNEGSTKDERTYRVMGAKNLGDGWTEVPSGNEADYNFFKVEVSMPNN